MCNRISSNYYFKAMQECYFANERDKLWKQSIDLRGVSGDDFISLIEADVLCAFACRSGSKEKCFNWIFCEQSEDWYIPLLEYPLLVQECVKIRKLEDVFSAEEWMRASYQYYGELTKHEIAVKARKEADEDCLDKVAERLYAICNNRYKEGVDIFKFWTDVNKKLADDRTRAAKNKANKRAAEARHRAADKKYFYEIVYMVFWNLKEGAE